MDRRRLGGTLFVFWAALIFVPVAASAAELKQATIEAFQKYVREAEERHAQRSQPGHRFLWLDESSDRLKRVHEGAVVVSPCQGGEVKVPDGLIHHWIGAIFIPGASLDRTLNLVHDYNNHKWVYKPEVVDSRLIRQDGNDYRTAVRLLNSKIVTVVLDADYEIRYIPLDPKRWYSESRTIRMREVENAGAANERDLPDGVGHGYVWRLNTYSRFEERDGGVYVECEAIALSRGYPFGLAWAIRPLVRDVPGDSMTRTLSAMRTAVLEVESGRLQRPRPTAP